MVKRLPAMRETQVQSLGEEDPLEKEMATHSSILAWKIPWTEDPGGLYSPWGCKESDKTERLHFHFFFQPSVKTIHKPVSARNQILDLLRVRAIVINTS